MNSRRPDVIGHLHVYAEGRKGGIGIDCSRKWTAAWKISIGVVQTTNRILQENPSAEGRRLASVRLPPLRVRALISEPIAHSNRHAPSALRIPGQARARPKLQPMVVHRRVAGKSRVTGVMNTGRRILENGTLD